MSKGYRAKDKSIAFHVSEKEMYDINARIKMSGLSRGEYFIRTFQQQEIKIVAGKYESDRLAVEFKKLREKIESLENYDQIDVLNECKALLKELKDYFPIKERKVKNNQIQSVDFDDIYMDVEVK